MDKPRWRKSPLRYTILTPHFRFLSNPSISGTTLALLFFHLLHHFCWSTIANPLCYTFGSTHYKRPQLLMACYSNCLPYLSHIHYHSFFITSSSWLPVRYRKLMYQSTWHHSPEDWKLNAICSKHLHCHLLTWTQYACC